MARNGGERAVADLIAPYAREVQDLVLATRAFVHKLVPGALEWVDAKVRVIGFGFGPAYKDMICVVIPNKKGVTLGIARGTKLPDPGKLLEGAGKVHRHVRLQQLLDLKNPALKTLVQGAVALWKESTGDTAPHRNHPAVKSSARARGRS